MEITNTTQKFLNNLTAQEQVKPNVSKHIAFTLAEVLITLGIIGVVAAMTIPTLMTNTNAAKFKAQYKKTLSTLNQAVRMSLANYDLDYSTLTGKRASGSVDCTANDNPSKGDATMCALLNGTLTGSTLLSSSAYTVNQSTTVGAISTAKAYALADGSVVVFGVYLADCSKDIGSNEIVSSYDYCYGYIDVNGATLPNQETKCDTATATAKYGTANNVSDCTVSNSSIKDIFPIMFHDATVEPATNAAKAVLTSSK